MSQSANTEKRTYTEEQILSLSTDWGYTEFVKGLASPPEKMRRDVVVLGLLVDELKGLNQASVTLDHIKRVMTYGDKLRMNPLPITGSEDVSILAIAQQKPEILNIVHGLLGIITEAIELAPILAEIVRTGQFDATNLQEELGDGLFYTELVQQNLAALGVLPGRAQSLGNTRYTRHVNVNKLLDRYKGATFEAQHALNRDLDSERRVMDEQLGHKAAQEA